MTETNIKNRSFKVFKKEEYAYKHTCCIKSIFVNRNKDVKFCAICINGVVIYPSSSSPQGWTFDFKILREQFRDYLGETKEEIECIRLEQTLTFNSLKAIQHYTLTKDELKNCIFTFSITSFG